MSERSSPTASRRITPVDVDAAGVMRIRHAAHGLVIAVFGARADVGVTTIATSLAHAFRSLGIAGRRSFAELDPRVVRARSQGQRPVNRGSERPRSLSGPPRWFGSSGEGISRPLNDSRRERRARAPHGRDLDCWR